MERHNLRIVQIQSLCRQQNNCALAFSSIYTHFKTLKKKAFGKHCGKSEIAQNKQFLLFEQCFFFSICILKPFNSHISVVVCSFFEFGTVSKCWIREWVKEIEICFGIVENILGKGANADF